MLNEQFIQVTGRSIFESQEKNPDEEVHEEFGFWSYDRTRDVHVYREFLAEGYVNRYVLESHGVAKLVLVTEAIENLPRRWQARTTFEITGGDRRRTRCPVHSPHRGRQRGLHWIPGTPSPSEAVSRRYREQ